MSFFFLSLLVVRCGDVDESRVDVPTVDFRSRKRRLIHLRSTPQSNAMGYSRHLTLASPATNSLACCSSLLLRSTAAHCCGGSVFLYLSFQRLCCPGNQNQNACATTSRRGKNKVSAGRPSFLATVMDGWRKHFQ